MNLSALLAGISSDAPTDGWPRSTARPPKSAWSPSWASDVAMSGAGNDGSAGLNRVSILRPLVNCVAPRHSRPNGSVISSFGNSPSVYSTGSRWSRR